MALFCITVEGEFTSIDLDSKELSRFGFLKNEYVFANHAEFSMRKGKEQNHEWIEK